MTAHKFASASSYFLDKERGICLPDWLDQTDLVDISIKGTPWPWRMFRDSVTGEIYDCEEYYIMATGGK